MMGITTPEDLHGNRLPRELENQSSTTAENLLQDAYTSSVDSTAGTTGRGNSSSAAEQLSCLVLTDDANNHSIEAGEGNDKTPNRGNQEHKTANPDEIWKQAMKKVRQKDYAAALMLGQEAIDHLASKDPLPSFDLALKSLQLGRLAIQAQKPEVADKILTAGFDFAKAMFSDAGDSANLKGIALDMAKDIAQVHKPLLRKNLAKNAQRIENLDDQLDKMADRLKKLKD